jgi:hypothetical protein
MEVVEGRFRVRARLAGRVWSIIVEPDPETATVVVVTVFVEETT